MIDGTWQSKRIMRLPLFVFRKGNHYDLNKDTKGGFLMPTNRVRPPCKRCNTERDMKRECIVLIGGFFRYAIVGGIAFLADFGTLVASQELLFKSIRQGVYISTVFGFIAGLTVNYALSLLFVFTQKKDKGKGRTVGAFLIFGAIGLLGLFFTEFGMWVGVEFRCFNYILVKFLVT